MDNRTVYIGKRVIEVGGQLRPYATQFHYSQRCATTSKTLFEETAEAVARDRGLFPCGRCVRK